MVRLMPKRSSKQQDVNQIAAKVVAAVTGQIPVTGKNSVAGASKNPAAVALGRLGGLKGGKARAKALSPQERRKIAQRAAQSRWRKKR
jgi:hypothetical protein